MLISLLFSDPLSFLVIAVGLIVAISIHEFAHGFVADKLGDPTPGLQGRLTLNPLAHLDPVGTLLIFIAGFGWGKPVVFDPYNLQNPKRDIALIALAGPVSNILLATVLSLIIRFIPLIYPGLSFVSSFLAPIIYWNVMLAIFNLIPIHPLDGGKILIGILPKEYALEAEDILSRYGMILLILLIFPFFGFSAVSRLISPVISFVYTFMLSVVANLPI